VAPGGLHVLTIDRSVDISKHIELADEVWDGYVVVVREGQAIVQVKAGHGGWTVGCAAHGCLQ
jgi:hypothetical protein